MVDNSKIMKGRQSPIIDHEWYKSDGYFKTRLSGNTAQ